MLYIVNLTWYQAQVLKNILTPFGEMIHKIFLPYNGPGSETVVLRNIA